MTVYTNTARFDGTARALTEDEMRARAPSIFATHAHESRSDRFATIPTIQVLRGLANEGFFPVGVMQSRTRTPDRRDFTKHLIRLRRLDGDREYQVGDTVCEILLKNANDGTSAYDLMAGLFRIRCKNSLVAQTGTIDSLKVHHKGDVAAKVIEGTYRVLDSAQAALEAPVEWSKINLDRREQEAFAEAVHEIRFDDEDSNAARAIRPMALLAPRRREDVSDDLWMTFNRAQENAIRGGLGGNFRDATTGRLRHTSTREVKAIDQTVRLNRALWTLTERMAEIKRAA